MKEIEIKFPWCTAAPRPTVLTNMDVEETIISYYTAPIIEKQYKTAVIKFSGVISIEHNYKNDQDNDLLNSKFNRDSFNIAIEEKANIFWLFFNNEYFKIIASSYEEFAGESSNQKISILSLRITMKDNF